MRVAWQDLSQDELDHQLSPSRSAKDAGGVLQRYEAETAALATSGLWRLSDQRYGPRPRNLLDLTADGPGRNRPCLAFIHGGFWQEGSKEGSGFAAAALARAGWVHAAIGYTLAPEATLAEITTEIAQAITALKDNANTYGIDPARIVLAGHSAGGHLAAAMVSGIAPAPLPCGVVAISGVYDLAPIAASYVNDAVGMSPDDAETLSPLLRQPAPVLMRLLIGGDEPDAFQRQTDALAVAWRDVLPRVVLDRVPGRDHFDILDELADPTSATFNDIQRMGAAT